MFLYTNLWKRRLPSCVCTRVMRLTLLTTMEEDRKLVEAGLNTSLNEMVSKSIGSENGIVLQFQSEALRL